jgi:hypothetical protein
LCHAVQLGAISQAAVVAAVAVAVVAVVAVVKRFR